jgi:hypothetical protein
MAPVLLELHEAYDFLAEVTPFGYRSLDLNLQ